MAPSNLANTEAAYRQAYNRLNVACTLLERHLPPIEEDNDDYMVLPSLKPKPRTPSVSTCDRCTEERENLDEAARQDHVCTHQGAEGGHQDDDTVSTAGSEVVQRRAEGRRRERQPNAGVIRQDLVVMDDKFDGFTVALSNLAAHLAPLEADQYEAHLLVWAQYCGWMKDRAEDTIRLLEGGTLSQSTGGTRNVTVSEAPVIGDRDNSTSQPSVVTFANSGTSQIVSEISAGTSRQSISQSVPSGVVQQQPITTAVTNSVPNVVSVVTPPVSGDNEDLLNVTNLELAIVGMNSISNSIDHDIRTAEQEIMDSESIQGDSLTDMKDFLAEIDRRIRIDYKEASENCVRLDTKRTTGAMKALIDNTAAFSSRLRTLQAALRRSRSGGATILGDRASPVGSVGITHSGYKPYIKKLEPPTFTGKVEDWPEFRSVWQDLLSDMPESIQIQHFKTKIPEADAKRVAGVKSMTEMWRRLEKVYGDTELNIITVKTNLENLTPKSSQDFKRILEVYEAIETAVFLVDEQVGTKAACS